MLEHITFGDDPTVPKTLAILIPRKDMKADDVLEHYVAPLQALGMDWNEIICISLDVPYKKKLGVVAAREYLAKVKPILDALHIKTVMCCDGTYFKALTKVSRVEPELSYPKEDLWGETSFYCPNFASLMFNPDILPKIALALKGVTRHLDGQAPIFDGSSPIAKSTQVRWPEDKKRLLLEYLERDELTCDIETFSLQVDKAKLGTISFAKSKDEGFGMNIDYMTTPSDAKLTRHLLREFFVAYRAKGGKLIFHGGTYDAKVLIWELFMDSPEDYTGMLFGLHLLFDNFDDTKTLAYLATNTTAGNSLSLKDLAFEYTGNYAIEIKDITKYKLSEVLEYNVIDACATWYVYDKYRQVVRDTQEDVYQNLFRPSLKTITQMECVGLPLNLGAVLNAESKLDDIVDAAETAIQSEPLIVKFTDFLRELEAKKHTARLKKKVITKEDYLHLNFNPGSGPQLQLLLYQELDLPVINKTKNKNPSTDADTLKALIEHESRKKSPRQAVITLLENFCVLAEAETILNTFIPAFKEKSCDKGGWRFLLGSFNLGGTKSGRLSSSGPNMQNLPSTGTIYASMIKECFQAPPQLPGDPYGWLYVGADYNSLEDMISALLTKDPNKMAVYIDGYDGHCLRAYSYFGAQMPDITAELEGVPRGPQKVAIINSIKKRYPKLRQASKGPTFALTYMGTWRTLMKTFGLSKAEAVSIENEFRRLYHVSEQWVKDQIILANAHGYVELAFGLKLRTPMLPNVIITHYETLPYEAYSEVKTAANALGQSYGLLNSYTANKFMERVWAHPKYSEWILPAAHIHDAQYYLCRNHLGCLKWMNDNLIECMEWQNLPAIEHPDVRIGAELEVYAPHWGNPIVIPNRASLNKIQEVLNHAHS